MNWKDEFESKFGINKKYHEDLCSKAVEDYHKLMREIKTDTGDGCISYPHILQAITFYRYYQDIIDYTTSLLKEQREEASIIISLCKTKLQIYRADVDGEYLGGMEYSQLMEKINNYFNAPEPREIK